MSVAPPSSSPIPSPREDDAGDVAWALQTAQVQWQRGGREESLTWLRRAAEAALEAEAWLRVQEINVAAAEFEREHLAPPKSAEAPRRPLPIPSSRPHAGASLPPHPAPPLRLPLPSLSAPPSRAPAARLPALPVSRRPTRSPPWVPEEEDDDDGTEALPRFPSSNPPSRVGVKLPGFPLRRGGLGTPIALPLQKQGEVQLDDVTDVEDVEDFDELGVTELEDEDLDAHARASAPEIDVSAIGDGLDEDLIRELADLPEEHELPSSRRVATSSRPPLPSRSSRPPRPPRSSRPAPSSRSSLPPDDFIEPLGDGPALDSVMPGFEDETDEPTAPTSRSLGTIPPPRGEAPSESSQRGSVGGAKPARPPSAPPDGPRRSRVVRPPSLAPEDTQASGRRYLTSPPPPAASARSADERVSVASLPKPRRPAASSWAAAPLSEAPSQDPLKAAIDSSAPPSSHLKAPRLPSLASTSRRGSGLSSAAPREAGEGAAPDGFELSTRRPRYSSSRPTAREGKAAATSVASDRDGAVAIPPLSPKAASSSVARASEAPVLVSLREVPPSSGPGQAEVPVTPGRSGDVEASAAEHSAAESPAGVAAGRSGEIPAEFDASRAAPESRAEAPLPSVPSGSPSIEGVLLADVRGLQDLPEEAQRQLVASAKIEALESDEELSFFAVALITSGGVHIMPAISDASCAYASVGEVVFTSGSLHHGVELRVSAGEDGTRVAVWDRPLLEAATVGCPWVADDLRLIADSFQALAGVAVGALGERLDDSLRALVTERCEVRTLAPNEVIVEQGKPMTGMHIVGGGRVELVRSEGGTESVELTLGPGDFLFGPEILTASSAPRTARAGKEGALVLFADRRTAHELMVSVPPLLEIFAG